jgi:CheY-specific phosphatase CheX
MPQTVQLPNVCDFMMRHVVDVFETMLSKKADHRPGAPFPAYTSQVTGSIGFGGENITGAVYFHVSAVFATEITTAMLGINPEEISNEHEINDVIGEATNMIGGGLKSWLCDSGAECAMSTPAIIRGTSFEIESLPDVERERLVFECEGNLIVVEIHIKLN